MQQRIAVAMSGGVDSSAAGWLLKQEGNPLLGVTLSLFQKEHCPGVCGSGDDVEDARRVAAQLGIDHHVLELSEEFQRQVIAPFVAAYERGRTPNPCVDCNRRIKFGALLRRVEELGAEQIATGHYVRRDWDEGSGRWLLRKAVHPEKDQSYVLYSLTQAQLAASRFPLGGLSKAEIREIAQEQGFVNAHKGESQDICFIPDGDYAAFIRRHSGRDYPEGPFLDQAGRELGRHRGIIGYTLGQRRGLGVSSNQGRLYVLGLNTRDNSVLLGPNQALFSTDLIARGLNLIALPRLERPMELRARVRYHQQEQPCRVEQLDEDTILVHFHQPQRAITPGQAVVLYDADVVVGGATILGTQEEAT